MQTVLGLVPDSIKASMVASARGQPEESDDIGASGGFPLHIVQKNLHWIDIDR
jgi:hypothetical protein